MTAKCHGTDYGYICHLAKLCRHVSPDATVSDAMLCEHLGFEHFMSHPSTTYGQISQAIREAEKRRGPEVVVALKREYARMMPPGIRPLAKRWICLPNQTAKRAATRKG